MAEKLTPEELQRLTLERGGQGQTRNLVVTIDFGTNFSRYVFWDPPSTTPILFEEPTIILFSPDKEIHTFGNEANEKFQALSRNKENVRDWYLFERFKMKIPDAKDLTRDLPLLDFSKRKSMPAMTVFSAGIRFLKEHAERAMRARGIRESEREIKWAVRVPGFWEDKARSFMRTAAEKAGIPGEKLHLVIESEAAALYFFDVHHMPRGTKFIVQDCGGGKTDVSAFEVQNQDTLKHIHSWKGSSTGGNSTTNQFEKLIFDLSGMSVMRTIADHELREMRQSFENSKRLHGDKEKIPIPLPDRIATAVKDALSSRESSEEDISIQKNEIILRKKIVDLLMNETLAAIESAFAATGARIPPGGSKPEIPEVYVTGGTYELSSIAEAIRENFPYLNVTVADNPSSSVFRHKFAGAGDVGKGKNSIVARMFPYTYGIAAHLPFQAGKHDRARAVRGADGQLRCEDCFHIHFQCNQPVKVDKMLPERAYSPAKPGQTAADIYIYRSLRENPVYVDEDDCERIGSFTVDMPDTSGGSDRVVMAALKIGGVELTLRTRYGGHVRMIPFSLPV